MMKVNPLPGVPHPRTSTVLSSSGTSDMRIPAVESGIQLFPSKPSRPSMSVTAYLDLILHVRHNLSLGTAQSEHLINTVPTQRSNFENLKHVI